MPIYPNPAPNFFPIIGSSFSDIANQQRGFGMANLDTQTQDIARRNAQDQARNSWLAQLAQLQRSDQATVQSALERDVGRQSEADTANIARGISAENTDYARQSAAAVAKEERRRFDIQANLQEKALDRTKAKEQDEMDQIASAGQELAPQLADIGQKYQQSLKDYNGAIAKIDTAAATIASSAPVNENGAAMIHYNPKARLFEPVFVGMPASQKAALEANVKLADQKSAFDSAKADHDTYTAHLRDMEKTLAGYGLMQGSDYSVFSPKHKKRWGGIKTVDALPPTPVVAAPLNSGWYRDGMDSSVFPQQPEPFNPGQYVAAGGPMAPLSPSFFPSSSTTTSTAQSIAAPAPSGRVRVRAPDGRIGNIPQNQLAAALTAGYIVVQ